MQIVIDIPQDIKNYIDKRSCYNSMSEEDIETIIIGIKYGTILPEHGKLVDADKLSDYFNKVVENYEGNNPNTIVSDKNKFSTLAGAFRDVVSRIKNAPTVLEGSD